MNSAALRGSASTNLVVTLFVAAILVAGWLWYARTSAPPETAELLAAAELPAAPVAYPFDPAIGIRDAGDWAGPERHKAGATETYTLTTRRMNRGGAVRPRPAVPVRIRLRVLAETDTWSGVAIGAGLIDSTTAPKGEGGVLANTDRSWAAGVTDRDGTFGVSVKLEVPPRDGPKPYRLELVADEFDLSADGRAVELKASTVYSVDVSLP